MSNEQYVKQLLKSDRLPVALWHESGRLLEANQPFCLLIGYSEDEIRNGSVHWSTLTIPGIEHRDSNFIEETSSTGFFKPYEEVFQRRDGDALPVIIGGARLQGEPGNTILFALNISAVRQPDELDRLEKRVFQLTQVLTDIEDQFLPHAKAEDSLYRRSEEFRLLAGQLSSAQGQEEQEIIQLLYEGLLHAYTGPSFRNALMRQRKNVREAASATADIVSKAIESSRFLTTELSLSIMQEGKLVPTLRRLAGSIRDRYGLESNLTLDPMVDFASEKIQLLVLEAVRELLMNVARYADVAMARVSVETAGNVIQLEVEDDGLGFDPGQLDANISEKGGLAMIRERIGKAGGSVQIFSAPGLGARCHIDLPLRLETERLETSGQLLVLPLHKEHKTEKPIQVLLVDDHTVIRQGIIRLLKKEPDLQIVGEAGDGESAIQLARQVKPDVVLMDVYMPGMGGVQATRLIHDELPQIRVLGLSMLEEKEMALLMQEAGAVGYLTKNGPSDALISAIRACA